MDRAIGLGMNTQKFTEKSMEAIQGAQQLSQSVKDNQRGNNTTAQQRRRAAMSQESRESVREADRNRKMRITATLSQEEKEDRRNHNSSSRQTQRSRNTVPNVDYFHITEEFLADLLQRDKIAFNDIDKDVSKAVLLYYLNSGYFRFQETKDYTSVAGQSPIDTDLLIREIEDEELSPSELNALVKAYGEGNSVDCMLLSCSSCGIRMFERRQNPEVAFTEVCLESNLVQQLLLSEEELLFMNF